MTTPKSNPSKHYKHFRKTIAFCFLKLELCRHCRFRVGHFQDFRPGFRFWHICHVDRHGHFTLKQLRLPVVNETHTNSYTGPRLFAYSINTSTMFHVCKKSGKIHRKIHAYISYVFSRNNVIIMNIK